MENSTFQFKNYFISKSLIEVDNAGDVSELSVNFNPGGELKFDEGKFTLLLGVEISDKEENLRIEINTEGYFEFQNIPRERLSDFLYNNAPAILFPYLRAYISTLTSLSGTVKPIILPTLNLSKLKSGLEANIQE